MKFSGIKMGLLLVWTGAAAILFVLGFLSLEIDFDVVASLPRKDPVIRDAAYIFKNHPMHDQILIDLGIENENPEALVEAADLVEKKLEASSLFAEVGFEKTGEMFPGIISHIADNLPWLFDREELENKVLPATDPEALSTSLQGLYQSLSGMESMGQSRFIPMDPLGLKDLVLARMAALAPVQGATIHLGKLISRDEKHLLITARPNLSSTDTGFARSVAGLMDEIQMDLDMMTGPQRVVLTPMGAYRAALDNETIVRRDVKRAIIFATVGIALLLLFAFPRPWIGLLSLLPALAGTAMAFFVYSLFHQSISIMVLGFGGAVISITVDHGIAYLLFLDRPDATRGEDASREIRAVGLIAVLTTMGAFLSLCASGFPILSQLGEFTALGIFFSYIFIHLVFPKIFPAMPPGPDRVLPLQRLVDRLASFGNKGAIAAACFACVMIFFARPVFDVNLSSMNTVSHATKMAETLFTDVWGNLFSRIHIMAEEKSREALQEKGDLLLGMIQDATDREVLSGGFVPAMIFPGDRRRSENFRSWKAFWSPGKITDMASDLLTYGDMAGFTADAFDPFMLSVRGDKPYPGPVLTPEKYYSLLGISKNSKNSTWVQFSSLTPGENYSGEKFYKTFSGKVKIFDPAFFSKRLGQVLFSTFMKMLIIIGVSVVFLLFFFFMDFELTLIAVLPVIFALISTLGTLKIIGHPLDIPALMLSIIVVGMGIDYSLFFVRSYQRYGDPNHRYFKLVRMAVFMASASTITGFGILCTAEHSLLRSAGLTSLFGIGYSLAGAFLILPPLLNRRLEREKSVGQEKGSLTRRVARRYRYMEAYPRFFAKFKMMLDPMFKELEGILEPPEPLSRIIDIGSGYGVPCCWLLEKYPELTIYGIDPDGERVRTALRAGRGRMIMQVAKAPLIPDVPVPVQAALALDMIHYLTDDQFRLTLDGLHGKMINNGLLIFRISIRPEGKRSFAWFFENFKLTIQRISVFYRPVSTVETFLIPAGFKLTRTVSSGATGELAWVIARKVEKAGGF